MGDPTGGLFGLASAAPSPDTGGVPSAGDGGFDPSGGLGGVDPSFGMGAAGWDPSGGDGMGSAFGSFPGQIPGDPAGSLRAPQPPVTDQPSATPPPTQQPQQYQNAAQALFGGPGGEGDFWKEWGRIPGTGGGGPTSTPGDPTLGEPGTASSPAPPGTTGPGTIVRTPWGPGVVPGAPSGPPSPGSPVRTPWGPGVTPNNNVLPTGESSGLSGLARLFGRGGALGAGLGTFLDPTPANQGEPGIPQTGETITPVSGVAPASQTFTGDMTGSGEPLGTGESSLPPSQTLTDPSDPSAGGEAAPPGGGTPPATPPATSPAPPVTPPTGTTPPQAPGNITGLPYPSGNTPATPATPTTTSAPGTGGMGGPLEQLVGQFIHMLLGGLGGRGGIGSMLEQMIDRALGINPQRMFPQYYGGGFNPPAPAPGSGYFPAGTTGGRAISPGSQPGAPTLPWPGPPGSQGNPPSALRPDEFISSRGGHTAGTNAPNLNPEFASRLARAGQAYEQETGEKAQFGETGRGHDLQAQYYRDYRSGGGGLAAPPGTSRHERGLATDIPNGRFQDWMHRNASRFGLEGLRDPRDPAHFQMAGNAPARLEAQQTVSGDLDPSKFERNFSGSPLAGQSNNIARVARANGVPPKLMASIIAFETGRGRSRLLREGNNPAGITGSGGGYQRYPTIEDGLEAAGRNIGRNWQRAGGSIARLAQIYAPVGARNDPRGTNREWPSAVMRFMQSF
ncbi:MAG TPA: glucosaminidase domain-containing protein [Candidatus Acidoferrum sp.]